MPATWANLKWAAGDLAISHDVYFGTDFDAVNEGQEGTFTGNTTTNSQVVGFPSFPAPDGLQLGETYYWRIDEVNPAEADSPWKGEVWSFTVPPKEAFDPDPADGAKFLGTGLMLSWTPGIGAKLHTVYFGTNPDDVSNASGAATQPLATYDPGAIEPGITYYWRVDQFDGAATHTGNVWSFTTAGTGGGLKGEYFDNASVQGEPVLTRLDPGIDFSWGADSPDPSINAESFSVRWRGELEIAFTEAYRFYGITEDGVRLWINDQLVIDRWEVYRLNEYRSDPIELQGGEKVTIEMWGRDNDATAQTNSATAQLMWESAHQAKGIIPAVAFSPPVRAGSPRPGNGAVDTRQTLALNWIAGDNAAQHDVYLGADADAVAAADTSAAGIYQGRQADTGFAPPKLDWGTTYYWRVDEINDVNPDSPWTGKVWSFTTANFLVVDDFEFYTDNDAAGEAIWQAWIDGFEVPSNGSQVGYLLPPYAEQAIVHGGSQSMPFAYDNTAGATNSEAVLTLTSPRDWTEQSVDTLSLWFRGYAASVGSFTEAPVGTFTMAGAGTDIAGTSDQFHFAYKTLNGTGSIVARVDSIENTHAAARAGVMIRETLDAGSKHAFVCVMPENGVSSRGRTDTNTGSFNTTQAGISAPHWVKLERDAAGNFTASHSTNGTTWDAVEQSIPTNIPMASNVYVGLALTSHNATVTCEAKFSNVTITGAAGAQWLNQDIGITSNAAEPLYVAVSNSTGAAAVVAHDDPAAAAIDTWTEWVIPLQTFADKGVNLADVDKIAIGLGTGAGTAAPGGSGNLFFDDIRLNRPSGQ
ncbi:MAG: PA14 domain-containing protein [Planctomycetota bacterium]